MAGSLQPANARQGADVSTVRRAQQSVQFAVNAKPAPAVCPRMHPFWSGHSAGGSANVARVNHLLNPVVQSTHLRVCRAGSAPHERLPKPDLADSSLRLGLFTYRERPRRQLVAWSFALGLALSAFWLTREEGVWLAPSLALIVGFSAYTLWRSSNADLRARLIIHVVPFLILGSALLTVSALNKAYYGVFATVEFKAPAFLSAYGSLCRVEHAHWRRYIPVPKETREEIYRYSPAFAELRPFLEGAIGDGWTVPSASLPGGEDIAKEMAGGWFMWALRDAVAAAGYCQNGKSAMDFYSRLAREVNRACDDGGLPLVRHGRRCYHPGATPTVLCSSAL